MKLNKITDNRKDNKNEKQDYWKDIFFLLIIISIVFAVKIILTGGMGLRFVDDASYFNMRKSLEILKNPLINFHDELSFSGRKLIFLPGFEYVNALLLLFFNKFIVFFIIQKILSTLYLIPLYLITKRLTDRESAAAATIVGATAPILFGPTTQSVITANISIAVFLTCLYSTMFIKKANISLFIISFLALTATSALTITFILGLLIYLLIASMDKIKTGVYLELTTFSGTIFILTYGVLFFKLIRNNLISNTIINKTAGHISLLSSIYLVGFIPLIIAIIEVNKKLFNKESRNKSPLYLLFSTAVASIVITIINTKGALPNLMVLSSITAILTGVYLKELNIKIKKSKITKLNRKIAVTILLTILLTNSIIALAYTNTLLNKAPSREEMTAMEFIKNNTPKNSTIFAKEEYGNLISYEGRKNIIDDNLIGEDNTLIKTRLNDINKVMNGISEVEALKILNKYNATYLLCDKNPEYISKDDKCFKEIFNNGEFKIYKVLCKVRTEELSLNNNEKMKDDK